ncbi:MAG: phosphoenolpyruvate synthase [Gammaproteobacteria bacterium]
MKEYALPFERLGMRDVARVGGKNASLGEMINRLAEAGVRVPRGYATTAEAFREFLAAGGLAQRIDERLAGLDTDDVRALRAAGAEIRGWILASPFPNALQAAVTEVYRQLEQVAGPETAVAVRSSATAEDLPEASFAGQQETFLNVRGLAAVLKAVHEVFASLYNDRAIAYRVHHGFEHAQVALSAALQRMVRSDIGASGVAFTLDTESGFRDVVFITSAYGLGETVVQGTVNPDEFYAYKPNLRARRPAVIRRALGTKLHKMVLGGDHGVATRIIDVDPADRLRYSLCDAEVEELARYALSIEDHYGRPMDIEWAKDGIDGKLYILQARPETVKSRVEAGRIERYRLQARGAVLSTGRSIGQRIGAGAARLVQGVDHMSRLAPGEVLIADMTTPDWEPVMKRAAAIVTNRGGRTCHAAIVARELGVPAVVGTGDATERVADGAEVTVSCAEGETGYVYAGRLPYERLQLSPASLPALPVKLMMNVGNPDRAFELAAIPNHGIGLARIELVINGMIGVHPRAIIEPAQLPASMQQEIAGRSAGYADPASFFVEKLAEGVATLAAAFAPKPVIVRLSDFKSNEYISLRGGARFEPKEENPMLGFRGASRYIDKAFRPAFELECRALRKVRIELGFRNVEVMVPFVRTVEEAREVTLLLRDNGLERGRDGLRVIMMCEIPSNCLTAEAFLEYFDGFSIGSNDLTQLTLGVDRDSGLVAQRFDERDPAVLHLLRLAIRACKKAGKTVGICGQGPSDHPDFARWLLDEGIDSISLNPDTVVETWLFLAGQKL